MAMKKEELQAWLESLPNGCEIGVDDGGLTLQVVDHDAYCEVGGLPEEE